MSQQVIKASPADIKKISDFYKKGSVRNLPPGAVFAAKTDGCHITAYKSGKVLFQGPASTHEAAKWNTAAGKKAGAAVKKPGVDQHQYAPPKDIQNSLLIGSDETGTGDYFGPMTVVAAHLNETQLKETESLGLRDSKTITDPEIKQIAPKLLKLCTYSLTVLRNEKYNKLQAEGMNQGQMKALLHHEAIKNVVTKLRNENAPFSGVLIDQFVKPEGYFNYLRKSGKKWPGEIPIYFATKAEGLHPSVAAGSILARYAFLQEMDKLAASLGVPIPKGAGAHVDKIAKEIYLSHGKDALYKSVKWHFSNTQRVL
ncbi:ribonuclease HIII [Alkalicoccus daliensis]|uniref:Ribonuclease HIII n=1 Tax=Alkalicoccus daliensis TaxID=745820 RepID=A0A1H0CFP2_9BACI|nr:ribonuclease HIII [Alkalicoccus daliensis]SDN56695.1 ribonuclease HIII [Alkalicoccus daliensis]